MAAQMFSHVALVYGAVCGVFVLSILLPKRF
jgi:hypothetical protein